MVRQQPLREISDGLAHAASVENDGEKLSVAERRGPAQLQLLARTLIRRHLAHHQPVAGRPGAILVTVAHGISFTIVNSARDQDTETQSGPRLAALRDDTESGQAMDRLEPDPGHKPGWRRVDSRPV